MHAKQTRVGKAEQEITETNSPGNPVVKHLQKQVSAALALYLNYKHYHWQVAGPSFRDLHLMFDEFAKEVEESLDELAERIRMIGQDPSLPFDRLGADSGLTVSKTHENVRKMIEEADQNSIIAIRNLRQAAEAADEAGDPGTVDLLSKVVRIHEKQEWYFRELLKSEPAAQLAPA